MTRRLRHWLRCPTCGGRYGRHDLSDFTGGAGDVLRRRFPHEDQLADDADRVGRRFGYYLGGPDAYQAHRDRGTSG